MARDLCGGVGVQVNAENITVGLLVFNLLATGLREAHTWIGGRETDHSSLSDIKGMIESANDRASENNSRIMIKIQELEHNVTRLKALEEARHFHIRHDDTA